MIPSCGGSCPVIRRGTGARTISENPTAVKI
ncbi:uncharacterized protein METZ01_LOCUS324159, partial [marine metagenome]